MSFEDISTLLPSRIFPEVSDILENEEFCESVVRELLSDEADFLFTEDSDAFGSASDLGTQLSSHCFLEDLSSYSITSSGNTSELSAPSSSDGYNSSSSHGVNSPEQSTSAKIPEEHKGASSCAICSKPASNWLSYGARSCNSCRSFFRRTIQSGSHHKFKCQIGCNEGPGCKKCRFASCLKAGMEPRLVMDVKQRENRVMVRQKLREKRERPSLGLSSDQQAFETLDAMKDKITLATIEMTKQFFISHPGLFKEYLDAAYNGSWMSINNIKLVNHLLDDMYTQVMHSIPDLAELCTEDRQTLIVNNSKVPQLLAFSGKSIGKTNNMVVGPIYEDVKQGKDPSLNELTKIFQDMQVSLKPGQRRKYITYDHFFKDTFDSKDTELRHKSLSDRVNVWYEHGYDFIQMVLLEMTTFFNISDIRDLFRDPKRVESIQTRYAQLLHVYLRGKFGQERAAVMLGKAIMLMPVCREARKLFEQRTLMRK